MFDAWHRRRRATRVMHRRRGIRRIAPDSRGRAPPRDIQFHCRLARSTRSLPIRSFSSGPKSRCRPACVPPRRVASASAWRWPFRAPSYRLADSGANLQVTNRPRAADLDLAGPSRYAAARRRSAFRPAGSRLQRRQVDLRVPRAGCSQPEPAPMPASGRLPVRLAGVAVQVQPVHSTSKPICGVEKPCTSVRIEAFVSSKWRREPRRQGLLRLQIGYGHRAVPGSFFSDFWRQAGESRSTSPAIFSDRELVARTGQFCSASSACT